MSAKIKILYVDDEEINTQLFQLTFNDSFHVLVAESGVKGLDVLQNNPDVKFVISDMRMPGMNGLDFVREVNKIKNKLPCMLLSGFEQSEEIIEAIQNKIIIQYMVKPFNKTKLEKLIQNYTYGASA